MEDISSLSSSIYFASEIFFLSTFYMKSAFSLSWLDTFFLVLVECFLPRCHRDWGGGGHENTMLSLFFVTVRESTNMVDSVYKRAEHGWFTEIFKFGQNGSMQGLDYNPVVIMI